MVNEEAARKATIRGLLDFNFASEPIPVYTGPTRTGAALLATGHDPRQRFRRIQRERFHGRRRHPPPVHLSHLPFRQQQVDGADEEERIAVRPAMQQRRQLRQPRLLTKPSGEILGDGRHAQELEDDLLAVPVQLQLTSWG